MTKQNNLSNPKNTTKEAPQKAPERSVRSFNRGDTLEVQGKRCIVVEILEASRWHVKNLEIPFDSFIVTDEDFNKEGSGE